LSSESRGDAGQIRETFAIHFHVVFARGRLETEREIVGADGDGREIRIGREMIAMGREMEIRKEMVMELEREKNRDRKGARYKKGS
jgi:hypothetical protein